MQCKDKVVLYVCPEVAKFRSRLASIASQSWMCGSPGASHIHLRLSTRKELKRLANHHSVRDYQNVLLKINEKLYTKQVLLEKVEWF